MQKRAAKALAPPKTGPLYAGRRAETRRAKGVEGTAAQNGRAGRPSMKGEVLRRAILETAVTLFIERGTAGTSIQDIAESLGLTRTAVYYYFKKKGRWCMDTAGTGVTPTPQGLRRQLLKCGRSSGVQRSACG